MALTRSQIMSRIRSKNTKPELELQRKFLDLGLDGFELHWGKFHIDIAWPDKKVAVFYDSCFWHQCPVHGKIPKTNLDFWIPKFTHGKKRELEVTEKLKEAGWTVVRIWGHDLKEFDPLSIPVFLEMSKERNENAGSQRFA
jgi:DNA mismatch endonuclease (patch repair protein)